MSDHLLRLNMSKEIVFLRHPSRERSTMKRKKEISLQESRTAWCSWYCPTSLGTVCWSTLPSSSCSCAAMGVSFAVRTVSHRTCRQYLQSIRLGQFNSSRKKLVHVLVLEKESLVIYCLPGPQSAPGAVSAAMLRSFFFQFLFDKESQHLFNKH